MEKLIKTMSISLVTFVSVIFFMIGYYHLNFNITLIGILLIWGANFLYGVLFIKKNINFLFYSCTFFILLLGQKTVYMLQGTKWWENFNSDIYQETLFILYSTLASILLGGVIYHIFKSNKQDKEQAIIKSNYFEQRKNTIRLVSIIAFGITLLIKVLLTIEKIIYVQGNSYLALYTGFETIFPSYIKKIADLYFIFLTMYLFTFPKRKSVLTVLAIYTAYLVLTIFVGSRGEFVTKILMITCYLAYRQFIFKNEKYYTKKTMIIISIVAIILIAFLGLYNYIRNDLSIEGFNFINSIKQFFIDQGISVDVISYSIVHEDQLRERQQNYTFGFVVNRFNSLIGKELPTGLKNTALYGNNLGAAISDLALKERYLNGEGLGTQYMAELYVDYGYAGIIIYNVVLGFVIVMTGYINEKNWLKNSILFLMFSKIIYLPRQFAADWFVIFISSSYILSFVLVIAISEILYKISNGKRYKQGKEKYT